MSQSQSSGRIVSMDQFRGYTVAGMFVVNFLASYTAIHAVFKHNNTYFSYADSIMPSFIFAVGFSFRLTVLRRRSKWGFFRTYFSYIKRSIALVVVSLMIFGFGGGFKDWHQFRLTPRRSTAHMGPGQKSAERERDASLKNAQAEQTNDEPNAEAGDDEPIEALKPEPAVAAERPQADDEKSGEPNPDDESATEGDGEEEGTSEEEVAPDPLLVLDADLDLKNDPTQIAVADHFGAHWKMLGLKLLKADLWETLAIIGVTQIFILPVIAAPAFIRFLAMIACGVGHVYISYRFNWDFVHGLSWVYTPATPVDLSMDAAWGLQGVRCWDGGFFGIMSWAVAMLAGTLTYDIMSNKKRGKAAMQLLAFGSVMMLLGYGMSCLTRLYDLKAHPAQVEIGKIQKQRDEDVLRVKVLAMDVRERIQGDDKDVYGQLKGEERDEINRIRDEAAAKIKTLVDTNAEELKQIEEENKEFIDARKPNELAASPVYPPFERAKGRAWTDLLAEAPFVQPPSLDPTQRNEGERSWRKNYWMMGKRLVSVSFITFSTGFAMVLFSVFIVLCDMWGMRIGLFRTFGMNPLAAYAIHEVILHASIPNLVPDNAPLWYCIAAFIAFMYVVYLFVRSLEKQNIFVRM